MDSNHDSQIQSLESYQLDDPGAAENTRDSLPRAPLKWGQKGDSQRESRGGSGTVPFHTRRRTGTIEIRYPRRATRTREAKGGKRTIRHGQPKPACRGSSADCSPGERRGNNRYGAYRKS